MKVAIRESNSWIFGYFWFGDFLGGGGRQTPSGRKYVEGSKKKNNAKFSDHYVRTKMELLI